ncbi:MAG: hypothetical protein OXC58_01345 [Acidimicrobiaceae bacterium]|nr:hypothetical protein [Acidimicrobiaceae bacterium]MCY4293487.1 hypothetical protein [Acidimicrobiaceae bacterium]
MPEIKVGCWSGLVIWLIFMGGCTAVFTFSGTDSDRGQKTANRQRCP